MDEKPDKRQKNELRYLSLIYPCLEDLTNGNEKKPIDIRIKLKPSQRSLINHEILVGVYLHVTCPPLYPKELPNIQLENSIGLTSENLQQLEQELFEVAKKKRGDKSIFDLCQCVQEFLYNRNKELLMQREEEGGKKLEEKERKTKELIDKLSEIINATKPETSITSSASSVERSNFPGEKEGCSHDSAGTISFGSRQIIRGICLEHFDSNHSVHIGIDSESGETYTVHEWKFKNIKNNSKQMLKQVRAIEQEFNSSIKSLKHDNLVSYYNISSSRNGDHYVIHTLEEQINSPNCHTLFIKCRIKIGIQHIRHIAKSVLKALDYLHSKNVVHRDLRGSCIYIDEDIVKVSSYATHRRLSELVKNGPFATFNKRKDIQRFGKFILELVSGSPISDEEEFNIPVSLPLDLYEFLQTCKDEEQQCTTAELLKHQFLNRNSIQFSLGDDESEYSENNYDFERQKRNLLRNTSMTSDQSRISSEFEFIESLGKGGFGIVYKYKNKLDERFYAIKQIQLNTKKKHKIKKIKDEVKLLSRLNHENVVRYHTSWIEEVEVNNRPSSCETTSSSDEEEVRCIQKPDGLKLAPPLSKNKVSTTYSHLQSQSSSDSESSDEEDDKNSSSVKSESDDIIFQDSENASNANDSIKQDTEIKTPYLKTYMYIQMEFCEKNTLRSAINESLLCNNESRVERKFREILEGLEYIHKQDMIHRDLKPENIFLDEEDRVKIGDFGLATLKSKSNKNPAHKSELDSTFGDSTTGNVGTTLYIAPEVNGNTKDVYDKKIDIYSLGIILFEMCYKPFRTGMERISVLQELRKTDFKFPEDYELTLVKKYSRMIRWLLKHNVSERPNVEEILQSEHAPPPNLEDSKFFHMISHTIKNPQAKGYKTLTANLFKQNLPLVKDTAYDYDESSTSCRKSLDPNYDLVKQIAVKVLTNHGAKNIVTPHFMPFSNSYTFQNKKNCVKLMTHGGDIVSLPSDLRVHFARYVAWNSLYLFKRYSIERVFHEQKVFGVSPKGYYECAFDIVTPTPGKNFLPDGEVLHAVYEILSELSVFNNNNVVIHLNHTLILKAIMIHLGIGEENHSKIVEILHRHETKYGYLYIRSYIHSLTRLKLTKPQINGLSRIFSSKHKPGKMPPVIKTILNSENPESKQYAEKAVKELNEIMTIGKAMGVKFDIRIVPGLLHNIQQFSGMICEFMYKKKKGRRDKKKGRMEKLASGGRYDSMITHYRNLLPDKQGAKNISQSAVGISIFLDKVVQVLQKNQTPNTNLKFSDVLICLEGECPPPQLVTVLQSLSSLQIQWILFQTNSIEEAEEYSEDLRIPHIVMLLKDYNEHEIKLKSWNEERSECRENTYNIAELVEELNRAIKKPPHASDVSFDQVY